MTDTMNFSGMTRLCHDIIKTYQAQNPSCAPTGFYDKLLEKTAESGDILETIKEQMSMAEYKLYIYDKIAAIQMHPSNIYDSVAVQITEEGFRAMKNDPEYEKWVLDKLRSNFNCYDPWSGTCGGKFSIFKFGATKEEYHAQTWRLGFNNGSGDRVYREKAKDSFWERRKKRRKELLEQLEELEEMKAVARRIAKSEYFTQLAALKPEDGQNVHPMSIDLLAMQIFSSLKIGVLLEPLSSRKVKV